MAKCCGALVLGATSRAVVHRLLETRRQVSNSFHFGLICGAGSVPRSMRSSEHGARHIEYRIVALSPDMPRDRLTEKART